MASTLWNDYANIKLFNLLALIHPYADNFDLN